MVFRFKNLNLLDISLFLFLLLFNLNVVFSAGNNFGVCCYSKTNGDIYFGSSCQNDDIDLGSNNVFYNGDSVPCTFYTNNRKAVEIDGICYGTVDNKKIYDNSLIFSYLGVDSSSIVDYNETLCSSSSNGNDIINGGGSGGDNNGINNSDNSNGINFKNTTDLTNNSFFCKDFGGVGGMFIDKNSCLSSDLCSYIPYLGGVFSTSFAKEPVFNFSNLEFGCISKLEYSSCFDYKTENLCNEDVNKFGNCEWVNSKKYTDFTVFNLEKGFCIEKSKVKGLGNVYFDNNYFPDRKNLFKNPFFGENLNNWNSNGVLSSNSYYGLNSVLLSPGKNLSQKVNNVFDGYVYQISFKASSNTNFGRIKVIVKAFNNSNYINTFEQDLDLNFETKGSYLEFRTNQFSFEDFNNVEVEFKNIGGSEINLDLVNFEAISKGGILISDRISKPFEIISKKASNCEICLEEDGLNFCTKKKANLLGDCSFMSESEKENYNFLDIPDYLGKDDNFYLKYKKSISLSNSQIFCELYSHNNITGNSKSACESPNNYINKNFLKFHSFAGNTLCKWNPKFGCFKDSNNDNAPDTRIDLLSIEVPKLRILDSQQKSFFETFSNYKYKTDSKISDFELGCDYFPPVVNFELIGKGAGDLNYSVIKNDSLFGDIYIKYMIEDPFLDSCLPFKEDFDKSDANKLFIDLKIGDKVYYKELNINQIFKKEKLIDFLNSFNGFNLNDFSNTGLRNISIIVYDFSGNAGYEFKKYLNLDLVGPNISISGVKTSFNSDDYFIGIFSKDNKDLNISISDFGGVDSCSYSLIPQNTALDSSYYNSSGNINLNGGNYKKSTIFTLPIFNSSKLGDLYRLTISCLDIFGMNSSKSVIFKYDQDIDLYLVNPQSYVDPSVNIGYLKSSSFVIELASREKNLKSCNAKVNGNSPISLNINVINSGYHINNNDYIPSDLTFYSNITGTISNLIGGKNTVNIKCEDNLGNVFEEEFVYVYDDSPPILKNYTLESYSGGNIYYDGNNYYSIDDYNLYFDIYLDPTNGLIDKNTFNYSLESPDINLSLINFDVNGKFTNFRVINFSQYNAIEFYDFSIPRNTITLMKPREKDLYEMNYNILFSDVSGNNGSGAVKYFYDSSDPKFEFSGETYLVDDLDSIYTDKTNPKFLVSFNTPAYRKFSCNLTLDTSDGLKFFNSFTSTSQMSFNLKDISSNLEMKEGNIYTINFNCVDVYGINLQDTFNLKFDNTDPILKDVYFANGNKKFLRNYENIVYDDLKDDIIFDLEDTSEEYYNCKYKIIDNSNVYDCNKNDNFVSFYGNINTVINNLNIVRGTSSQDEEALCVRNDNFYNMQSLSFTKTGKMFTNIKFEFECFDAVNKSTEKKEINYGINYIQNDLADFEINYSEGRIFSKVLSFTNFDKVIISSDAYGKNVLEILTNPNKDSNNMYEYNSLSGVENALIGNSEYIYAVVLDANGEVIDRISKKIINDAVKPTIKINILDEVDGKIYSNDFEVDMQLDDYDSGPKSIRAYLNDELVYDYLNLDLNSSIYQVIVDKSDQYINGNSLIGKFVFSGLPFGKYKFEVIGEDKASNFVSKIIEFEVVDGVGIILKDSSNAKVDLNKIRWVTKSKAPILSFKTTKVVDNCIVYPFVDSGWNFNSEDNFSQISKSLGGGTDFSIDLSSNFILFDLTNLDDIEAKVKISCYYNSTYYDYERRILYADFLPDYVLSLDRGFSINQDPFESLASIKSVGPYRPIKCSYAFNNGVYKEIGSGEYLDLINFNLDFSTLDSGNNIINLKCEDLAGNVGPEKKYNIYIDRTSEFKISELKIYSNEGDYLFDNNTFYLNSNSAKLSFKTNFKEGVSCSYRVDSLDGTFSGIINFFRNLFSVEQKEITPKDSFEFIEDNILFNGEDNRLIINCVNDYGSYIEEYDVKVNQEPLEFNIN